MPSYKLTYFTGRGRGEIIRMVFAVAGVEYEDNRVDHSKWTQVKPDTLCKQVPELEVDGIKLTESRAIYRYLAREYGLFGKNNLETAKIEAVCSIAEDMFEKIAKVTLERDADTKTKLRHQFQTEFCGKYSEKLENILEYYNSNGDYFIGNQLTLADIVVFYLFHDCVHRACGCEQAFCVTFHPTLKKIYNNCLTNDKLKAWIEKRPFSDH